MLSLLSRLTLSNSLKKDVSRLVGMKQVALTVDFPITFMIYDLFSISFVILLSHHTTMNYNISVLELNIPPENLKAGRFHDHLRDTFAPLVVRYVDLMESSIAQSLHKGFEKEKWEIKG